MHVALLVLIFSSLLITVYSLIAPAPSVTPSNSSGSGAERLGKDCQCWVTIFIHRVVL